MDNFWKRVTKSGILDQAGWIQIVGDSMDLCQKIFPKFLTSEFQQTMFNGINILRNQHLPNKMKMIWHYYKCKYFHPIWLTIVTKCIDQNIRARRMFNEYWVPSLNPTSREIASFKHNVAEFYQKEDGKIIKFGSGLWPRISLFYRTSWIAQIHFWIPDTQQIALSDLVWRLSSRWI